MSSVRINVAVDEKIHRNLKVIAASQGRPLKDIVVEALRDKINKEDKKKEA